MVFLGVAALFVAGIVRLFDLRFSTGEVYAVYSTLRGDPLGSKALYYSLRELPGLRVERNVRPLRYLGEEPSAVLKHRDDDPNPTGDAVAAAVFYLGASPFDWPFLVTEPETVRLETLMNRGGRVIIAFQPTTVDMTQNRLATNRRAQRHHNADADEKSKDKSPARNDQPKPESKPPAPPSPSPSPATGTNDPHKGQAGQRGDKPAASPEKDDGDESPDDSPAETPAPTLSPAEKIFAKQDLVLRWHMDFHRAASSKKGTPPLPASTNETAIPVPGLPDDLKPVTWHTAVDFDLDAPAAKAAGWHALYTRAGRPVIVARPFGTDGGELLLVSDPYFFSNESLRNEPHPELLSRLIGPCRRIIFDETHLGVAEKPGMMTLARRYHLQGTLYALALLAILFLWKNMVSLVPPPPPGEEVTTPGNFVTGRDSAEGFVNLLRRGVPAKELLKMCLTQWRTSGALPGGRAPGAELVARLDAIAEAEAAKPVHRRSAVAAYQAMCSAIKRRGAAAPRP